MRGFLELETGLKPYKNRAPSGVELTVDPRLKELRPYIACSVVKGAQLSDVAIKSLMHLQDKLDQTYGRGRKRTSIGLYELDLIRPPITYTVSKPEDTRFTPLGFDQDLNLAEILLKHPKGIEYGHIVKPYPHWPILKDAKGDVLSFPPIINSDNLGKITPDTKNILIEVTGTARDAVFDALTIITLALADRSGEINSTNVLSPFEEERPLATPKLETSLMTIQPSYIDQMIGLRFSLEDVQRLLEKSRYRVVEASHSAITVEVPCYRKDVMHPIDIVEDIAIAYGVNKIVPRWPPFHTTGGLHPATERYDKFRKLSIGFGFQEVLTFNMTCPEKLFTRMNLPGGEAISVSNPRIATFTCLRTWLIPSLLELLSMNTHYEYPQKIFEVGDCATPERGTKDGVREFKRAAYIICHPFANFTEMKAILEAIMANFGLAYQISEIDHGSFIAGRVGEILIQGVGIGIIGEINPLVLENWGLEMPASAMEIEPEKLFNPPKAK